MTEMEKDDQVEIDEEIVPGSSVAYRQPIGSSGRRWRISGWLEGTTRFADEQKLNQFATGRIVQPFTDGIEFVNAIMRRLDRKMLAASPTMITYDWK